jgi:hypothetical protein
MVKSFVGSATPIAAFVAITGRRADRPGTAERSDSGRSEAEDGGGRLFCWRCKLAAAEGVTTARKRFGALSRFLDWCQDAGHVSANPCALIARSHRPNAPQARSTI